MDAQHIVIIGEPVEATLQDIEALIALLQSIIERNDQKGEKAS